LTVVDATTGDRTPGRRRGAGKSSFGPARIQSIRRTRDNF
jgi:hypothetical protein